MGVAVARAELPRRSKQEPPGAGLSLETPFARPLRRSGGGPDWNEYCEVSLESEHLQPLHTASKLPFPIEPACDRSGASRASTELFKHSENTYYPMQTIDENPMGPCSF